jgi:hypothetical protein
MAKLKGVELKKIVSFKGHEGEPLCQGDLYLDGKKIGFYSDGDWGGTSLIQCSPQDYAKLEELGAEFKLTFINGAEMLLSNLRDLIEDEKMFKNAVKQGFMGLAVVKNHSPKGYIMVDDYYRLPSGYTPQQHIVGLISHRKTKQNKETSESDITLYTSLADFIKN